MSRQVFRDRFLHYLRYVRGRDLDEATPADQLAALQLTVREPLIDRAVATAPVRAGAEPKTVYYLSMEYLLGRLVENNLIATGLRGVAADVMTELGLDLERIVDQEPDPGLGNGGLGRLAACFLESLATLDYPAFGYGLRYDFGIFRQEFSGGWQRERPDTWLEDGYGWEIARPDLTVAVHVGGTVSVSDGNGRSATPGPEPAWSTVCLTTCWSPASARRRSRSSACGKPKHPTSSTSTCSRRATS